MQRIKKKYLTMLCHLMGHEARQGLLAGNNGVVIEDCHFCRHSRDVTLCRI